jgi:hypothetical protein
MQAVRTDYAIATSFGKHEIDVSSGLPTLAITCPQRATGKDAERA